ncbi:hypothetical protein [uncultured Jatrophihabitans sp.]|uniref:hypothetical protein n=1 Tax=uncultured Jatrophihabitans sp. TaxID=1610747 RepID=UPI0035CBCC4A
MTEDASADPRTLAVVLPPPTGCSSGRAVRLEGQLGRSRRVRLVRRARAALPDVAAGGAATATRSAISTNADSETAAST